MKIALLSLITTAALFISTSTASAQLRYSTFRSSTLPPAGSSLPLAPGFGSGSATGGFLPPANGFSAGIGNYGSTFGNGYMYPYGNYNGYISPYGTYSGYYYGRPYSRNGRGYYTP